MLSSGAVHSWRWDRVDTTDEAFEHDRYHCLRGATRTGSILVRPQVDAGQFAACMALRGYTRSDTGQFGADVLRPL